MATFGQGAGIVSAVVHVRYIVVVAVAVVICMVIVFAAPGTALPRTALRAQRAADVIMATLRTAAIVASSSPLELKPVQPPRLEVLREETFLNDILVLSCTLIC